MSINEIMLSLSPDPCYPTAGTYEDDPWLLMHDGEKIIYRDRQEIKRLDKKIDPYTMYTNNLKEA